MRPFLCALTSLPALAMGAGALAGDSLIGTVERIENRATAQSADRVRDLARNSDVFFDEVLHTYEAARLDLRLVDDSHITMGPEAALRLDRFVFSSAEPGGALGIRLLDGAFLFTGGAVEGPDGGHVRIRTRFAAIAVRGTTLWAGPIDDSYGVLVLSGEARVGNAGQNVTLGPGEGTTLRTTASPPSPPVVWPQAKVDRALAAVAFRD